MTNTFSIVYLPGDGIGPEVGAAALDVLNAFADRFDFAFTLDEQPFGGVAIDQHGSPFPQVTQDAVAGADAVLLGAVGGPKWDNLSGAQRPEAGLLGLRKAMGVWANVRTFTPHKAAAARCPLKPEILAGVDLAVVRELTGGAYFGKKSREGDRAVDECVYTVPEVERIVRRAASIARGRKKKLASIDKANVMETSRLWREVTTRVMADEFPDVELSHVLVDAMAMYLVQRPADFDVIVTENMFGDILTDEAAVLTGSLGLIPSASLGDDAPGDGGAANNSGGTAKGLYEPAHGSAPDIAGQGKANPLGMILSTAMMLRHSLGQDEAASAMEYAAKASLDAGVLTADLATDPAGAASTQAVTDAVLAGLREAAPV